MQDHGAKRATQHGHGDPAAKLGHAQEQRCCFAAHTQAAACGKTLPSAHLLVLHVEECHSALWAERRARGEQVYACFDPFCAQRFGSATERAHHLVAAHLYPAAFFFLVVDEGIEGAQARWGPAAGLVAPTADLQLPALLRRQPAPSAARKRKQSVSGDADMESPDGFGQDDHAAAPAVSACPTGPQPAALHALAFVPRSVRHGARLDEPRANTDACA